MRLSATLWSRMDHIWSPKRHALHSTVSICLRVVVHRAVFVSIYWTLCVSVMVLATREPNSPLRVPLYGTVSSWIKNVRTVLVHDIPSSSQAIIAPVQPEIYIVVNGCNFIFNWCLQYACLSINGVHVHQLRMWQLMNEDVCFKSRAWFLIMNRLQDKLSCEHIQMSSLSRAYERTSLFTKFT